MAQLFDSIWNGLFSVGSHLINFVRDSWLVMDFDALQKVSTEPDFVLLSTFPDIFRVNVVPPNKTLFWQSGYSVQYFSQEMQAMALSSINGLHSS